MPRWPLVVGLALGVGGLVLPPGGAATREAVQWWRGVGGAGWCQLAYWLALAWTGLRRARLLRAPSAPNAPEADAHPL